MVLSFPSEYTQLINTGESYSILGSELRRIEFGSTDLKTLTGAANSYNDILSRDPSGNSFLINVSVGFLTTTANVGNKLFDNEIFTSYDPSGFSGTFKASANVSTYEITSESSTTIDGGFRNLNLYNLRRGSKYDIVWGASATSTPDIYSLSGTYDILKFGSAPTITLSMDGFCQVPSTTGSIRPYGNDGVLTTCPYLTYVC